MFNSGSVPGESGESKVGAGLCVEKVALLWLLHGHDRCQHLCSTTWMAESIPVRF